MNIIELKKEQVKLAKKVITKDDFDQIDTVGACDQSYSGDRIISAVCVIDQKTLKVLDKKYAVVDSQIKYIPGFLSYRESPSVIEAVTKLEQRPDVLLIEGNGIIHPRKIGIASHLGILLDIPTISITKKMPKGENRNGKIYIDGEKKAVEIITKEHSNPIYVSVGHRVGLKTAEEIVRKCITEKHKMPEPLHQAHKYSNFIKKQLASKGDT